MDKPYIRYCGFEKVRNAWLCIRANVDEADTKREPRLVWVRNDWILDATKGKAMDYEREDKAALHNALLNMHVCPRCRADLLPVANLEHVWGCKACSETWHIQPEE